MNLTLAAAAVLQIGDDVVVESTRFEWRGDNLHVDLAVPVDGMSFTLNSCKSVSCSVKAGKGATLCFVAKLVDATISSDVQTADTTLHLLFETSCRSVYLSKRAPSAELAK